jgi:raffinose/stachyose/melibiose transport system substrate-binding protein
MKKLSFNLLVIVVALTLMLSACAPAATPTTSAPAAPATAATATTAPVAPAAATATTAPAAPVASVSGNLSFMSWMTQAQYQPILDAFKAKYPDVTIDFQNTPPANDQYRQKLNLLANSGELPDLFYVQPPVDLMAKNKYLADISNLPVVQALPAGFKAPYTVNGKTYAYAPDAWVGGVFYNKALFKDNNLSEPKTWADFLNACKVFSAKGIIPVSFSGEELDDAVFWIHNTEVLSGDPSFDAKINTGATTFTQGYLDALNTWKKDMIDTGYVTKDMAGMSDDERMNEFATGKAAMTISGPWAISGIKKTNPNIDLGIFPFVGSTPDKVYNIGAVNVGIAMSTNPKNAAAAEAFLNFLGSEEGLKLYQAMTGNFMASSTLQYSVDPIMEVMKPIAASGKFAFAPVFWVNTGTLAPMMVKGTQEIVLGTTTPEQLVKDLDAKQAELAAGQ